MYKRLFIILIFLIAVLGFAAFAIIVQSTKLKTETRTIQSGVGQRQYAIHLPGTYNGVTKIPAIIAFHGRTSNPFFFEVNSQLSRVAAREGFAMLYPSWDASVMGEDDVIFTKDIVIDVTRKYAIDANRIYLLGFSNGALMTQRLITEEPGMFRAAAMISGFVKEEEIPQKQATPTPIPVMLMYGEKDKTVPYTSFSESMRYWTIRNGCALSPEQLEKNDQFVYYRYTFCMENATVQAYVIKDRGHIWPNSLLDKIRNPFSDTLPATETVINFFKEL